MRILTVADFFYPDVVGGSAIVDYEVMKRLAARGHDIRILTRGKNVSCVATPRLVEGMKVHSYSFPESPSGYPMAVIRNLNALKTIASADGYDLINIHHASSGLGAVLFNDTSVRAPIVFCFHGPWHKEAMAKNDSPAVVKASLLPTYWLRKKIDTFVLRRCTSVVTLSDYMLSEADDLYSGTKRKHAKIPCGVDIDRFAPAVDKDAVRRKLGLPTDKIALLTVRRLSARMGLENLVRAMAIVEREQNDILLLIAGKGELALKLEALIGELNLQNTRLLGYVDDKDLPGLYQASDLFIMPSLALEGYGLSTLEALACGVPVLGTPTGATPEVLKDVLPDFILSGISPHDMATGILEKIPQLKETAFVSKLRLHAERFSWNAVTDVVEAHFKNVVCG